jgi:hypothetical protein
MVVAWSRLVNIQSLYRQRQKDQLTSAITVTNSSLPTSIKKESAIFPTPGMNA